MLKTDIRWRARKVNIDPTVLILTASFTQAIMYRFDGFGNCGGGSYGGI